MVASNLQASESPGRPNYWISDAGPDFANGVGDGSDVVFAGQQHL